MALVWWREELLVMHQQLQKFHRSLTWSNLGGGNDQLYNEVIVAVIVLEVFRSPGTTSTTSGSYLTGLLIA